MKNILWLVAVSAIAVLFFQCQKELGYTGGPDTNNPVLPDPITASLQGNITDENDQPAAGVTITAGTSTTITDAGGYFRFTDARLDKNTTLVTASKDGYFKGYRVFGATSGCNQVVIKLVKKDLAGTVAASAGGEVSLTSGAKISLPAGGIVTASSNSAYSGDVKVYASYINPKSSDISRTIPGSLTANDKNGKRVALESYGMLAVELASSGGEKLQIKSGSTAILTIPIPSQSVASAPATIPLWYVDETTGIWQQEGTATKQGNNYIGEVKHFSFWNCDYPLDAVTLSLTLHTPGDAPLVNAAVRISVAASDTSFSSTYGYTDSLGQVSGLVPSDKQLTLEVLGNCGSAVYSQNIQPLTQDKNLGTLKITDNTSSLITITGLLADCNNAPVSNGYCFIYIPNTGDRYISVDPVTGKFSTTFILCAGASSSGTILGVDNSTLQQGSVVTINSLSSVTDVGTISACGTQVEQYIKFTIDNTDSAMVTGSDSSVYGYDNDSTGTYIAGGSYTLGNAVNFTAQGRGKGTFPMTSLYFYRSGWRLKSNSTVTFTSFPTSIGEFYEGSMSADYSDYAFDTATIHKFSGTFKVRKNF